MDKKKVIKLVIFAITTALAVVIAVIPPFEGLKAAGMRFLAIFIWWVVMMVLALIPNHMSCIIALVLAVATGCATTAVAFSAFAGTTVWLLVGAFGMATAIANSGLLNRLALNVMRLFPGTYTGQMLGLTAASIVCAPTVPSSTAKCTILVPLAGMIADKMGYAPHSKGTVGMFNIVNVLTNQGGNMFLTGSALVGIIIATANESLTWFGWLKAFVVWGMVVIVLTVLFNMFYYKPAQGEGKVLSKEELKALCSELGPMSKKEISALIILLLTVAAWMTESIHGIPTYAVALISWTLMVACGLFSMADFMTKILWPVIVLVGGILGLITILSTTGVGVWISGSVSTVVTALASTPTILLLALCAIAVLLMFAMIQGPVSAAVFIALLSGSSINPLIISFVVMLAAQVFVLPFQQPAIIAAIGVSGGRVEHKDIVPGAWAWIITNIIAVLVSIPWWKMIGMIG